MRKSACPRSFEPEALRDGRLTGAERMSFQRHLESCPNCSREVAALKALAERLCSSELDADADELHVRRQRTRLIAAFDSKLAPPERTPAGRRWLVGIAAASLMVLGSLVFVRARGATHSPESAVVVHADGTASWSRRSEGATEKILLERGALSIRVDHTVEGRRLLVVLPDGELEDIGTTFTVSADAGRTTRVSVESGSVVLRIHGQPPLALSAGDTWPPAQPGGGGTCASCEPARVTATASVSPTPPGVASSPASKPASPLAPARSTRAHDSFSRSGEPVSPSASAANLAPDPSLDFRAAITALDRGDNTAAAARFSTFLHDHPGDARCEDAAYLRVLALQRSGQPGTMKEAAAQYLRQYPNGFRRAEVGALAR